MEEQREKAERSIQTYAALGVGFVCIVVGVPLWWKTTEVYRVQLPYQEITQLAQSQVNYYVDFTVLVFNDDLTKAQLAGFGESLKNKFKEKAGNQALNGEYRGKIVQKSAEQAVAYEKSSDIHEFESRLRSVDSTPELGRTQLVLLPHNNKLNIKQLAIGKRRNIFVPALQDLDVLVDQISTVMRNVVVNEGALHKVFYTAKGVVLTKADKESMRSLRSHTGYDVTFTLLNPEPNAITAEWDIQQAISDYMDPMLKAFSEYAEISVKSQYLYYASLGVKPNKDGDLYKLTEDDLPHIITPVEAHLGSHVSTNPNLNFILYITPRQHQPMQIYDKQGVASASNSFLSPRWGGMLVYNVDTPPNASYPARVELDMERVMEVFLSQLRLLLGVNTQIPADMTSIQPGRDIITDWEMDQWLRVRTLENIATATSTLRSLAQLLEEISNIVINDDIGREVERSVSAVSEAQSYLQQSRLKEAFLMSRQALISSEKAFFDPSLLELLYFPEDQKFAIYIPLFLPISIPVFMSVMQAVKRISGKDKQKTE